MTNPPPIQPPGGPKALDYGRPEGPRHNVWWMVMVRILTGIVLACASVALGVFLAHTTRVTLLWVLPPAVMLGALIVVAVRFRRFGYVTGFVIAPFVIAVCLFVLLLIFCGVAMTHP